ncbi:MAG: hypothetical protein ACP5QR_09430 [Rhizomicrobium sp.]
MESALSECAITTPRRNCPGVCASHPGNVLVTEAVAGVKIRIAAKCVGFAGIPYWSRIAERFGFNRRVLIEGGRPIFRFMMLDWHGRIAMDPLSSCATQSLARLKNWFCDVFACSADHNQWRNGTKHAAQLLQKQYLSVAISCLFQQRLKWGWEGLSAR